MCLVRSATVHCAEAVLHACRPSARCSPLPARRWTTRRARSARLTPTLPPWTSAPPPDLPGPCCVLLDSCPHLLARCWPQRVHCCGKGLSLSSKCCTSPAPVQRPASCSGRLIDLTEPAAGMLGLCLDQLGARVICCATYSHRPHNVRRVGQEPGACAAVALPGAGCAGPAPGPSGCRDEKASRFCSC